MSFNPPLILKIKSDQNELVFVSVKKGVFIYKYTKSKTKLGKFLNLNEEQLKKLINFNT